MHRWAIEFRSGTFFQNLEAANGGPANTARRFASKAEADAFMDKHYWIAFNGGMAVPLKDG